MQNVKTSAAIAVDLECLKAEREPLVQQLATIESNLKKQWRDEDLRQQRAHLINDLTALDLALKHTEEIHSAALAEECTAEFTDLYDKTDEALLTYQQLSARALPILEKLKQAFGATQTLQEEFLYTWSGVRNIDFNRVESTFERAKQQISNALAAPVQKHDVLTEWEDELVMVLLDEWQKLRTEMVQALNALNEKSSLLADAACKLRDIGLSHEVAHLSSGHKWQPAYLAQIG